MKFSILMSLCSLLLIVGCGGNDCGPIEPQNPAPPPGVKALEGKSSHSPSQKPLIEQ